MFAEDKSQDIWNVSGALNTFFLDYRKSMRNTQGFPPDPAGRAKPKKRVSNVKRI